MARQHVGNHAANSNQISIIIEISISYRRSAIFAIGGGIKTARGRRGDGGGAPRNGASSVAHAAHRQAAWHRHHEATAHHVLSFAKRHQSCLAMPEIVVNNL